MRRWSIRIFWWGCWWATHLSGGLLPRRLLWGGRHNSDQVEDWMKKLFGMEQAGVVKVYINKPLRWTVAGFFGLDKGKKAWNRLVMYNVQLIRPNSDKNVLYGSLRALTTVQVKLKAKVAPLLWLYFRHNWGLRLFSYPVGGLSLNPLWEEFLPAVWPGGGQSTSFLSYLPWLTSYSTRWPISYSLVL